MATGNNLLYYKAVVYKDAVHRPLGTDERLTADSLPISALAGNQIRANADGLYVGPYVARAVYYVDDVNGHDVPTAGDKATPFLTLDYAVQQIVQNNNGDQQISYTVALKAGGTFTYTQILGVAGNVKLTFYGDPKYGDFDAPGNVGRMATYMPTDLLRPVINIGLDPNSSGGIGCFLLNPPFDGSRSRLTFSGVWMNLPTGQYNTGYAAIVQANQKTDAFVVLEGSVVNAIGDDSTYGFISVLPSATVFLYQFGSQFRVDNVQLGADGAPPPTLAQLQRRKWFVRMHPDFYPTEQTGYDPNMQHASPGSGLLSLSWSDVFSATDPVTSATAQNSWPVLADAAYGFGQYVNILHRDNQGRPLNVLSGRLFSFLLCAAGSAATLLSTGVHNLMA